MLINYHSHLQSVTCDCILVRGKIVSTQYFLLVSQSFPVNPFTQIHFTSHYGEAMTSAISPGYSNDSLQLITLSFS